MIQHTKDDPQLRSDETRDAIDADHARRELVNAACTRSPSMTALAAKYVEVRQMLDRLRIVDAEAERCFAVSRQMEADGFHLQAAMWEVMGRRLKGECPC